MKSIRLIKGQTMRLKKPEDFSNKVFWSTGFLRYDGNFLKNAGYYKIKRELRVGEAEGERRAEAAKADHLLKIDEISNQDVGDHFSNKERSE